MKFFTRAWASGELSDEQFEAVFEDYPRHIAALIPVATPGIRELIEVNVHDAIFDIVTFDRESSTLCFRMICVDDIEGYETAELTYFDASTDLETMSLLTIDWQPSFTTRILQNLRILRGRALSCRIEALYSEVDKLSDGRYEHRWLYWAPYRGWQRRCLFWWRYSSPHEEFTVTFPDVSVSRYPLSDKSPTPRTAS